MNASNRNLVILGAGGHAAVVAEAAVRAGWIVVGIASRDRPDTNGPFAGAEWLGDPDGEDARDRIVAAVAQGARLHAAVGDASVRERWVAVTGGASAYAAVVDPTALVSPSARVGHGVFIAAGAVVHARATVGFGSIINTRAIVEHDCVVADFAHISPGAVLCGAVRVGRGAQVGAGAVVVPNRMVGDRAIVGAGAVVVRDVEAGLTAVGVPAVPRA